MNILWFWSKFLIKLNKCFQFYAAFTYFCGWQVTARKNGPLFARFRFFSQTNKIVHFSVIRTPMIRFEGNPADHHGTDHCNDPDKSTLLGTFLHRLNNFFFGPWCGQAVSVLAFQSNNPSSNPAEAYSLFCKICV